jgi:hypothetical protein
MGQSTSGERLLLIWLILVILLGTKCLKATEDHEHRSHEEDEVLNELVLEEKQAAYLIDGSRDLEDDPIQYCSSMMEVTSFSDLQTVQVQALYSVATGYPNNLRRCIIVKPTKDLLLQVTITSISTEANFDFVEVYPIGGFNRTSLLVWDVGSRMLQLSGVQLPSQTAERTVAGRGGQTLMLVLRTDGNRNVWTGFQASIQSKYRDCYHGMAFIAASLVPQVFSDGYVTEYPPNYSYCWVLAPPAGNHLQIVFTSMNTERDVDTVELSVITSFDMRTLDYQGKRTPPLAVLSGLTIPGAILAGDNEIVLVLFRSDETLQFSGFSGRVTGPGPVPTSAPTGRPTPRDCDSGVQNFTAPDSPEGLTILDGLDSYYLDGAFCYIVTPTATTMFVAIDFVNLTLTNYDQIEIFALRQNLSTNFQNRLPQKLAILTSDSRLPWTLAGGYGQSLVIQLRTDKAETGAQFAMRFKSIAMATTAPTPSPIARECASGMVEFGPPGSFDQDLTIDGWSGEAYSDNYQFCAVMKTLPGYRLALIFDRVSVEDDRVDVFQVQTYNLNTRRFSGRQSILRRFNQTTLSNAPDFTVRTTSDLPTIVSLRTNFGRNGQGFVLRTRLLNATNATSSPVSLVPSVAPTPAPFKCNRKMTVFRIGETPFVFNDGFRTVPRGTSSCWILSPTLVNAYIQVDFNKLGLGTGATLEIGYIRSYDQTTRTYEGFISRTSIIEQGRQFIGRPGEMLIVLLTTDRKSTRTAGFVAAAVTPCFCPMYENAGTCGAALCGCLWTQESACAYQSRIQLSTNRPSSL